MANNSHKDRFFDGEVLFVARERGTISALICCGGRIFTYGRLRSRGDVLRQGVTRLAQGYFVVVCHSHCTVHIGAVRILSPPLMFQRRPVSFVGGSNV